MPTMQKETTSVVRLPVEPTMPAIEVNQFRWLIHGWPKVGKTTLASLFPNPVFACTEIGYRAISVYKQDINSWSDMSSFAQLLINEKHEFKTVVIDVFERLYRMLWEQVARDSSVKHVSDLKYGKGYDEANQRMYRMLESLYGRGLGIVLICHSQTVEVTHGGMSVNRTTMDLSASPRQLISGWPDVMLCLMTERASSNKENSAKQVAPEFDVANRVAICQNYPEVEAGGRIRYMPASINLGTDPLSGYKILEAEFRKAIARQLDELKART